MDFGYSYLQDKRAELLGDAERIRDQKQGYSDIFNGGQPLTMGEFNILSHILETSEDKESDVNRFAQALIYHRQEDMDIAEAYQKVDILNQVQMGRTGEYTKHWTQAISDSYRVGDLNKQRSDLGMRFRELEIASMDGLTASAYRTMLGLTKEEAEEQKKSVTAQIDDIDRQIEQLRDNTPRNIVTSLLKLAAGSLPYTGDILMKSATFGAGVALTATGIGSLVGVPMLTAATLGTGYTLATLAYGAATTAYGWKRAADMSKGAMYYDLRRQGVEQNIAEWATSANGWVQGAVENFLGMTPMAMNAVTNALGREAATGLTTRIMSRMYGNGAIGGMVSGAINWLKGAAGEGAEEFFQSIADNVTEYAVSEISESGYSFDKTAMDVLKEALYEGVAGFGSSLILGGIPAMINTKADIKYSQSLKADAESIASLNQFINKHENDEAFSDMSGKEKRDVLEEIYNKNNKGITTEDNTEILDTDVLPETNEAEEGLDDEVDENYKAEKLKRKEDGTLFVQESRNKKEIDGKSRRTLNIGSPDTKQRFGRIIYDVDENGDIEIKRVLTKAGYAEDITYDAVDALARRYAGHDITWNPENKYQQSVRDKLIADNLVEEGKIQRYKARTASNISTEYINNFAKNNRMKGIGVPEAGVVGVMLDDLAASQGLKAHSIQGDSLMGIDDNGAVRPFIKFVSGEGVLKPNQLGGISKESIRQMMKGGQAIVYVAQHGNVSTLMHEIDHAYAVANPENSARMVGILKNEAKNGKLRDYINDYMTLFKKRTKLETAEEVVNEINNMSENPLDWNDRQSDIMTAFLERYFTEGRTFNPELQGIFDRIADWFKRIFRFLKQKGYLSDEIVKGFDERFKDSPMKAKLDSDIAAQSETEGMLNQDDISPDEIAEAERQYAEIEAQYKGTSEWLKAPNGKPTNLTERQWVQVRTPAFKAWFGDWENDPQNASKVVDENGEPRVVYHGTPNEVFDVFDVERVGENFENVDIDYNFFFTASEAAAKGYGNVMPVFLNIRNPHIRNVEISSAIGDIEGIHEEIIEAHDFGSSTERVSGAEEGQSDGLIMTGYRIDEKSLEEINNRYIEATKQEQAKVDELEKQLAEADKNYYAEREKGINALAKKWNEQTGVGEEVAKNIAWMMYKDETYPDAVKAADKVKEISEQLNAIKKPLREAWDRELANVVTTQDNTANVYAVNEPNQIKSATDNVGTFSQSNPSILFQTDTEYLDAVNSGDMAKAQAMVDQRAREQGYTIKAYHGSPATDITEFDKERIGEHTTAYGDKAFWFSDSQKFADDFAYEWEENKYTSFLVNKGKRGRLYSVDLKINKPFDLRNITPEMREMLFEGYKFSRDRNEFDEWLDTQIKNRNHQSIKLAIDYNLLKENGYDAVIANLDTIYNEEQGKENADAIEYGVFSPNQIKSADPVTYDDNGQVIPFSQRFDEQKNSLLFQEDIFYDARQALIDEAKELTLDEYLSYNRSIPFDEGFTDEDEQFLTEIWNEAHNIKKDRRGFHIDTTGMSDDDKDKAFKTVIDTDEGVRNIVSAVRDIYSTIRNFVRSRNGDLDEEDMALLNDMQRKKERIESDASKFFVNTAKSNEELDEKTIKQLRTTMENDILVYRAIVDDITESETYSASEDYETEISDPVEERDEVMSDEDKKDVADQIENEELKKDVLTGDEKFDGTSEKVADELETELDGLLKEEEKLKGIFDSYNDKLKSQLSEKDQKIVRSAEYVQGLRERNDKNLKAINKMVEAGDTVPQSRYEKINKANATIREITEGLGRLIKQKDVNAFVDTQTALRELRKKIRDKRKQLRLAKERHEYKVRLRDYLLKVPGKNINYDQAKEILEDIDEIRGASGYDNDIIFKGTRYTSKDFRAAVDEGKINKDELSAYQKKRYENKSLSDYTVEDLEQMAEKKRMLTNKGRELWQQKVDQRNYEASLVRRAIAQELRRSAKYSKAPLPGTKEEQNKSARFLSKLHDAFLATLRMNSVAQMLDGDKKGEAYDVLVDENRILKSKEYAAVRKRVKPVIEAMQKYGITMQDIYNPVEITIDGQKVTYSVSQLIYGIYAQKNARNKAAFSYGDLVTQQEKDAIREQAERMFPDTERQWAYIRNKVTELGDSRNEQFVRQAEAYIDPIDHMRDFAELIVKDWNNQDNKERLNRVMIDEYNQPIEMEDFYMPIKRLDFNGTDLASKIADDVYNQNAGKGMTSVEKGLTKSRIDISPYWQQRTNMDFVGIWLESVKEQEHLIATDTYVRKLNRIFKVRGSNGLRADIENVHGRRMMKDIDDHINDIANPPSMLTDKDADRIVKAMRGKLYEAYLGMKLSSFVLQVITSPAPFLREVNPVELAENIVKVAMHPIETWKFITEKSPMMENRVMNPMQEDIDQEKKDYTKSKAKRKFDSVTAWGTGLLNVADRWMVSAGWLACYDRKLAENLKSGMDAEQAEQSAIKFADDVVYETQPMSDRTELAPLFKRGGAAWQALTQFQVSLNVIWNNLMYDMPTAWKNGQKGRAARIILSYAMAGIVLYAAQEGLFGDDDDDKDVNVLDIIRKVLYAATTQGTSSIPLVGGDVDRLLKKVITGEKNYYATRLYPALSTTIDAVGNLLTGNIAWNTIKKIAEGIGLFTGLPVSGAKEFYHAIHGKGEGDWRLKPGAFLGRRDNKKKKKK